MSECIKWMLEMMTVLIRVCHDSYFGRGVPVLFYWRSILVRNCEFIILPEWPLEIRTSRYTFLRLQHLVITGQVR